MMTHDRLLGVVIRGADACEPWTSSGAMADNENRGESGSVAVKRRPDGSASHSKTTSGAGSNLSSPVIRYLEQKIQNVHSESESSKRSLIPGLKTCTNTDLFVSAVGVLFLVRAGVSQYVHYLIEHLHHLHPMPTRELRFLQGADKIGFTLPLLFVAFYGNKSHKPLCVAVGSLFCSVSCVLCTVPYILEVGASRNKTSEAVDGSRVLPEILEAGLCQVERNSSTSLTQCQLLEADLVGPEAFSLLSLGLFVLGVGTSLIATLAFVYIEENSESIRATYQHGVLLGCLCLGELAGILTAWQFMLLPNRNPEVELSWIKSRVGPWWIGFAVASAMFFVLPVPLLFFPKWIREPQWLIERQKRKVEKYMKQIKNEKRKILAADKRNKKKKTAKSVSKELRSEQAGVSTTDASRQDRQGSRQKRGVRKDKMAAETFTKDQSLHPTSACIENNSDTSHISDTLKQDPTAVRPSQYSGDSEQRLFSSSHMNVAFEHDEETGPRLSSENQTCHRDSISGLAPAQDSVAQANSLHGSNDNQEGCSEKHQDHNIKFLSNHSSHGETAHHHNNIVPHEENMANQHQSYSNSHDSVGGMGTIGCGPRGEPDSASGLTDSCTNVTIEGICADESVDDKSPVVAEALKDQQQDGLVSMRTKNTHNQLANTNSASLEAVSLHEDSAQMAAPDPEQDQRKRYRLGRQLKDLPQNLWFLMTRPVFVLLLGSSIFSAYGITAFQPTVHTYIAAFAPFYEPPVSILANVPYVVGSVLGMLVAVAVLYDREMSLLVHVRVLMVVQASVFVCYLLMMAPRCPAQMAQNITQLQLPSSCSGSCDCSGTLYDPVCTSHGEMFPTACHAGCRDVTLGDTDSALTYSQCLCVTAGEHVSSSLCQLCQTARIGYCILVFLSSFVRASAYVSTMLLYLRSFPEKLRSITLGFAVWVIHLAASVPGVAVFHAFQRSACLWTEANCFDENRCWHHDLDRYSYLQNGVTALFQFTALALLVAMYFVMRKRIASA